MQEKRSTNYVIDYCIISFCHIIKLTSIMEQEIRKNNYDLLQSQTIDLLRFPLAVAVVFIHSFGFSECYPPSSELFSFSGTGFYDLIRICFSLVVTHIAVPTFFLISGFLFFYKVHIFNSLEGWKKKLSSRFRTLVIPYLLWNLIAILIMIVVKVGAFILKGKPLSSIPDYFRENGWLHLFWDCNVWGENQINWLGTYVPNTGPVDLPLWFLRDLIVVVMLSPVIFYLLKHLRFYLLYILLFCYVSRIWPSIPGLSITAIFFFSVGAYIGIYGKNLVKECQKVKWLSYASVSILLPLTVWFGGRNTHTGSLIYPFFVVVGVCAAFNLASWLLETGRVKNQFPVLGKSSFFIYATHMLLILNFSTAICTRLFYWNNPATHIICYFLIPLLTVAICFSCYLLMQKYMPKILAVLIGNR